MSQLEEVKEFKEVNPPKFIQIATSANPEILALYALDELGSVYIFDMGKRRWNKLPSQRLMNE